MRTTVLALFSASALLVLAVGCTQAPDVDYTIPADGQTGVAESTEVTIAFTRPLDPESATDIANYVIFGSSSGASESVATLDETGRIVTITPTGPFVTGEKVTVSLTSRITTSISIPLDDYQFSFRIAGVEANADNFDVPDDQFTVSDVDPNPGSISLSRQPLVRATFSAPVHTDSVSGSVAMRGSLSGLRSPLTSSAGVQGEGAEQTAAEVLVQLEPGEKGFEPGETVTVTYTNALTGRGAGETPVLTLRPYVASFEARGGMVGGGFSDADPLALGPGQTIPAAVDAVFGEFLQFEGPELALLDSSGLIHVLRRTGEGSFILQASYSASGVPIGIRAADVDDDGLSEIVTVLRSGQIEILQMVGQDLVRTGEPVLLGVTARTFEVADLDGDALLDIVVGVDDGLRFVQQGVTVDLETFQTITGFFPVQGDPLDDPIDEIAVGDLDRDGRPELVARSAFGTTVLRNAGSFLFANSTILTVEVAPGTVRIADFDGDGFVDVVTGGLGGLFVHLNPGDAIPEPTWGAVTVPLGGLTPVDLAITNIDGDTNHLPDVLVYAPGAADPLQLWTRVGTGLADLVPGSIPVPGVAPVRGLALADVNRDGARDILLHGETPGGTDNLRLAVSSGVVDLGDPDFAYELTASPTEDLGTQVIPVGLIANLGEDISSFTVAIVYDDAFSLTGIALDAATFPSEVVPEVTTGPGVAVITIDVGPDVISSGDSVQLLEFQFRQAQTSAGTFEFSLENGLVVDGETANNQVVLSDGGVAFPDLTEGSVSISMVSSVASVENISCNPGVDGEDEFVSIGWTNPETYDSIRIRRNGLVLVQQPGSSMSFTDTNPPGGGITYQVVAIRGGVEALPVACTLTVIPVPGNLSCQRLVDPTQIRLTWNNSAVYDSITIRRDGSVLSTLFGSQTGYTDATGDLNGHAYEVIGVIDDEGSAPAFCPGGEVPDAPGGSGVVDPVSNVVLVIEQGDASLGWQNGEAYSGITIARNGTEVATLPGTAVTYGESDLPPGTYQYSVRGDADGLIGTPVLSAAVASGLPAPTDLTCALAGGNAVELFWTNTPVSYTYDEIRVERTADGGPLQPVATLPGDATSFLDSDLDDGDYSYTVIGVYGSLEAESAPCASAVQNLIRVVDLTTVPGRSTWLEVVGQLLGDVDAYSFELLVDATKLDVLEVVVPGIAPSLVTTTIGPVDPVTGLQSVAVSAPRPLAAGFGLEFARVRVDTVDNFSAVGSSITELVSATIDLAGGSTIEPTLVDGALTVEGFGLYFEPLSGAPGELVEGWIYGTFQSPIFGYELSMQFDPDVLTVVELSEQGTVGEGIPGLVFTNLGNGVGFAALAMIVLPGPDGFIPVEPRIAEPLAFVRFQVDLEATAGTTVLDLVDWITPGDDPDFGNSFFDESSASVDPVTFPGSVEILITQSPSLALVDPATGSGAGGASVVLEGTGFTGGMTVAFGGVPALSVQVLDATSAVAVTPGGPEGSVDVTVTTQYGTDTLVDAYTYEPFLVDSVEPNGVSACDATPVVISGTGFPADLWVTIGEAPATVLQVLSDGSEAVILPPDFVDASPGGLPTVDLVCGTNGGATSQTLVGGFTYLTQFIRGDVNADGFVNVADIDFLGSAIAGTGPMPGIVDAADVNDDGIVHIGDLVYLSAFLFEGGAEPPAPYPALGDDPTPDGIGLCP